MPFETERKNTTGCVAKEGSSICKRTAAPGTAGLLCTMHLEKARAGEKLNYRSGLAKYQYTQLDMIKKGIEPLGLQALATTEQAAARKSAPHKSDDKDKKGGDKKVEKFLLSFPAIFALTGTLTLLLFEQVWTTALGISLPFGAGLNSGISPLLPQLLVYLLAMAVVFIVLMMSAVWIAIVIGALISTGFLLFSGWPLCYLGLLYASRVFDSNSYNWLRWSHDGARGIPKNKEAVDANWNRLQGWLSRQVAFLTAILNIAASLGSWSWKALFGAETVTARVAVIRAIAILVAFGTLSVLTSFQGIELRKQLAAQDACGTLHADLGDALVRLPPLNWFVDDPDTAGTVPDALRVVQRQVGDFVDEIPVFSQLLADSPEVDDETSPTTFQVMTTFLRVEVPCGRVTVASATPLAHTPLHDNTLRPDAQLSGEAFYLGRYGDWVVFAPRADTEKRVLLSARQVLGFSRVDKENLPLASTALAALPDPLPSQVSGGVSLVAVQSDLNALRTQVEALTPVNTDDLATRAAERLTAARPWQDDLRRAAQDHAELTRFVTAATQRLLAAVPSDITDAAIGRMAQALEDTLTAVDARPVAASLALPDAVARDLTAIGKMIINAPPRARGTPATTPLPLTGFARQKAALFDRHPGHNCDAPQTLPTPVLFGEGQTLPTAAQIAPIADAILREQKTAGTVGRLVIQIKGFASGTGNSRRNAVIAEARADNVKRTLVEKMFTLLPPANGDRDGPELLTERNMIIIAESGGEALDGVGSKHPRRADIALCWLEHPPEPG